MRAVSPTRVSPPRALVKKLKDKPTKFGKPSVRTRAQHLLLTSTMREAKRKRQLEKVCHEQSAVVSAWAAEVNRKGCLPSAASLEAIRARPGNRLDGQGDRRPGCWAGAWAGG